jgi:hypothetical protein
MRIIDATVVVMLLAGVEWLAELPQSPREKAAAIHGLAQHERPSPFWSHLPQVTDLNAQRGSRLHLILLDVNGDGREEIFITPAALCGNGGCVWTVYSPTGRSHEVSHLGEARFSAGSYRFDGSMQLLTHCWRVSADVCTLGAIRFANTDMQPQVLRDCRSTDPTCSNELALIRQWQTSRAPAPLEAVITVDEVVQELRWTEQKTGRAATLPLNLDRLRVM